MEKIIEESFKVFRNKQNEKWWIGDKDYGGKIIVLDKFENYNQILLDHFMYYGKLKGKCSNENRTYNISTKLFCNKKQTVAVAQTTSIKYMPKNADRDRLLGENRETSQVGICTYTTAQVKIKKDKSPTLALFLINRLDLIGPAHKNDYSIYENNEERDMVTQFFTDRKVIQPNKQIDYEAFTPHFHFQTKYQAEHFKRSKSPNAISAFNLIKYLQKMEKVEDEFKKNSKKKDNFTIADTLTGSVFKPVKEEEELCGEEIVQFFKDQKFGKTVKSVAPMVVRIDKYIPEENYKKYDLGMPYLDFIKQNITYNNFFYRYLRDLIEGEFDNRNLSLIAENSADVCAFFGELVENYKPLENKIIPNIINELEMFIQIRQKYPNEVFLLADLGSVLASSVTANSSFDKGKILNKGNNKSKQSSKECFLKENYGVNRLDCLVK